MEEAIYIITHIIMAGCCIMIVVVGMNFKEESCLISDESGKLELDEIATMAEEKKVKAPLQEPIVEQKLQLTTN